MNKLLSDMRAYQETNHCVLGGLVPNFTQKSSHTSRYYYVLDRESKHVSLAVKFLSRFYQSEIFQKLKILLYDHLKDTVTLRLLARGGRIRRTATKSEF